MVKLSMIEGIGEAYQSKLKDAGIASVKGLLEACAAKKGRSALAQKTGISEKLILKWANHADLGRIKGIGGQYAELLEAAGVDTVPELSKRKADKLMAKMTEVNLDRKLVRKLPVQNQVEAWIKEAAALPRILKY